MASSASGSSAKSKGPNAAALRSIEMLQDAWIKPEVRAKLHEAFTSAGPYKHVMLRPFLGETAYRSVRADLERLEATEKETDLFRFFQTQDIAPRPAKKPKAKAGGRAAKRQRTGSADAKAAAEAEGAKGDEASDAEEASSSALQALTKLFGSEEYRKLCQDITHCGDLNDRVDLSAQVYPQGGHLLCHDDVIGTRKISFIYYLTDPDEEWTASEGGALELYPADPNGPPGTPATTPSKEILPLSDALVFFCVEPGVSFHAVREVRGGRARPSIQGWLHAPSLEQTAGFEMRGAATLQQLLQTRGKAKGALPEAPAGDVQKQSSDDKVEEKLSAEDKAFLSRWLAPEYLEDAQMTAIAEKFADSSYAMFTSILRKDVAADVIETLQAADLTDGLAAVSEETEVPRYDAGVADGWTTVGPPHLKRYLEYGGSPDKEASSKSCHAKLGAQLSPLARELMGSAAFRRWLSVCTRLQPQVTEPAKVQRYRPGLDYTVAAHAALATEELAELDVVLTFTAEPAEATEMWASEEVGGFMSYLEADDEKDESVEAQEVYRGSFDEGPLLNVPAASNSLSVVMRDRKTLRFVKYLSRDAPSSRADVAACFMVEPPEGGSDVDDDDEEVMVDSTAASSSA